MLRVLGVKVGVGFRVRVGFRVKDGFMVRAVFMAGVLAFLPFSWFIFNQLYFVSHDSHFTSFQYILFPLNWLNTYLPFFDPQGCT